MKKHKTHRREIVRCFEITDFLKEIDKVLPTVQTEKHRIIINKCRAILIAGSMSHIPEPGEPITCHINTEKAVGITIEILRYCGVAPPGWPQPPSPDELLQYRKTAGQNQNGRQSL